MPTALQVQVAGERKTGDEDFRICDPKSVACDTANMLFFLFIL